MSTWTAPDIPDQTGRTAVVTGANSGLCLVTATELARHGADVVLAVRNTTAGEAAAAAIQDQAPDVKVSVRTLDLASLDSVRAFAERAADELDRIDLLVNNAGLVILGDRQPNRPNRVRYRSSTPPPRKASAGASSSGPMERTNSVKRSPRSKPRLRLATRSWEVRSGMCPSS